MIEFDRLRALADDVTVSSISTGEGVRAHLTTRGEVLALRHALQSGALTFDDVKTFVHALNEQFVRGRRSSMDFVIAAIAVAIEPLPPTAMDDFLEDLARVRIAEMPIAPRVARLALQERRRRLAQLTIRDLDIAYPLPQSAGPSEERPFRIDIGVDYRTLDLAAA